MNEHLSDNLNSQATGMRHAALWLIGPDIPGLLNMGARFVSERGGNIDKDIADKFGEKAVVFLSITAEPDAIDRMDQDKDDLKKKSGCGVVFQPMNNPTVPDGYQPDLHGFDIVCDDAIGVITEITELLAEFHVLIVGHTGERHVMPGPRRKVQAGQKYVVMLPYDFDAGAFNHKLNELIHKYNGQMQVSLKRVPGLLWWW